jgi:hypothetical protein
MTVDYLWSYIRICFLQKPFRQYELIIAVCDNTITSKYDDKNEKDEKKETIQSVSFI